MAADSGEFLAKFSLEQLIGMAAVGGLITGAAVAFAMTRDTTTAKERDDAKRAQEQANNERNEANKTLRDQAIALAKQASLESVKIGQDNIAVPTIVGTHQSPKSVSELNISNVAMVISQAREKLRTQKEKSEKERDEANTRANEAEQLSTESQPVTIEDVKTLVAIARELQTKAKVNEVTIGDDSIEIDSIIQVTEGRPSTQNIQYLAAYISFALAEYTESKEAVISQLTSALRTREAAQRVISAACGATSADRQVGSSSTSPGSTSVSPPESSVPPSAPSSPRQRAQYDEEKNKKRLIDWIGPDRHPIIVEILKCHQTAEDTSERNALINALFGLLTTTQRNIDFSSIVPASLQQKAKDTYSHLKSYSHNSHEYHGNKLFNNGDKFYFDYNLYSSSHEILLKKLKRTNYLSVELGGPDFNALQQMIEEKKGSYQSQNSMRNVTGGGQHA